MTQDNKETLKLLVYRYGINCKALGENIDPDINNDLKVQTIHLEKKIVSFIDSLK